ncbi:unnamed protein product [Amoebophrya sp. A120]|nr:unnamed protein product [Amoebophrya sp. A120]|eukprot:GSA120T00007400001.1
MLKRVTLTNAVVITTLSSWTSLLEGSQATKFVQHQLLQNTTTTTLSSPVDDEIKTAAGGEEQESSIEEDIKTTPPGALYRKYPHERQPQTRKPMFRLVHKVVDWTPLPPPVNWLKLLPSYRDGNTLNRIERPPVLQENYPLVAEIFCPAAPSGRPDEAGIGGAAPEPPSSSQKVEDVEHAAVEEVEDQAADSQAKSGGSLMKSPVQHFIAQGQDDVLAGEVEAEPKFIALTIDDGLCSNPVDPDECLATEVFDLLKKYNATATFFLVEAHLEYANADRDLKRLVRDGHEMANHGLVDKPMHRLSKDEFEKSLLQCNTALEKYLLPGGAPAGEEDPREDVVDVANNKKMLDEKQKSKRFVQRRIDLFRSPSAMYSGAMSEVLRRHQMLHILGDTYCDDLMVKDADWVAEATLKQVAKNWRRYNGSDKNQERVRGSNNDNNVSKNRNNPTAPISILITHMPERSRRQHLLEALDKILYKLVVEEHYTVRSVSEILQTVVDRGAAAEESAREDVGQKSSTTGGGHLGNCL